MAVTDETGRTVRAALSAQGRFLVTLAKGHTYGLAVEASDRTTPVVFPRASGALDATFVLRTNGASLELGQVQYHQAAPAGGFSVLSSVAPSAPNPDCVDCVKDDQGVTCDDGEGAGASTETADTAGQADPSAELATASQNVPAFVDGCDSEGGDDGEQKTEGD